MSWLIGTELNDTLVGGVGDDRIISKGGSDVIDGGGGIDRLDYRDSLTGITITYGNGYSGIGGGLGSSAYGDKFENVERIFGSFFDDSFYGNHQDNYFYKAGGNDHFDGGLGGKNWIDYRLSQKALDGEGLVLDLMLFSNTGRAVFGGGAENYIDSDGGIRQYLMSQVNNGVDYIDRVENISATENNDRLRGSHEDNEFNLRGGDDLAYGYGGDDILRGGAGNDKLYGHTGEDFLRGEDGHDSLYGGGDDDELRGEAGNDYLFGDIGSDKLKGGSGQDILNGGVDRDVDRLYGGDGADIFAFTDTMTGRDWIKDFEDGVDTISFRYASSISSFDDIVGHMRQSGSHVIIELSENDDIVVSNLALSDLTENDFIF